MGRTKLTSDDNTKMRPHVLLDDRPAHKVTFSAFQMDKREVTNAEYRAFVDKTKHPAPYHWMNGDYAERTADLPVYNVTWDDASAFCQRKGERLPTEAEWEYVARGGKDEMDYPWGNQLDAKLARFNVGTGPGPVAKFPPNDSGFTIWRATSQSGPPIGSMAPITRIAPRRSVVRLGPPDHVFFRNWVRPNSARRISDFAACDK